MKKQLTILVTGILAAHAVVLAPALAQEQDQIEGKFYCGKSYDPVGKQNIPTTLLSSSNREKPLAVILWKSEHFGKNFTPNQRCNIVSPKFQAAYTSGKLEYLVTGTHKATGAQIVCGVANQNESCDSNLNLLFTLKPYTEGTSVLKQLVGNIQSGEADTGIVQGSGNREVVSLRALLKAKR
jgi:Circadian oscillating protein COP23